MSRSTTVMKGTSTAGDSEEDPGSGRPGVGSVLGLSAWSGLVAGLLEVAAVAIHKRFFDPNALYMMSRHFIWLLPVTNLCVFVVVGVIGALVSMAWGRPGRRVALQVLCALTILPAAMVSAPQIHSLAWCLVAMGLSIRLSPWIERHGPSLRRIVRITSPAILAVVLILVAAPWIDDWLGRWRERSRPTAPPGSPNILLIVMDTVAAGHLGLHGYERPTSTSLAELAARGIRFASARSACSWTLPSHATMFTGRWMHELSVGWLTPLDGASPTIAEHLRDRGYETAGFVANTRYCARDSGLARGFDEYRDYIFPGLTAFKRTILVSRCLIGLEAVAAFLEEQLEWSRGRDLIAVVLSWFNDDRKTATVVHREFLTWLSGRHRPERPFFAFLNDFDAHHPYLLPPGHFYRFGGPPSDARARAILEQWGSFDKRKVLPRDVALASLAYDDCVADLDERLGLLTDRLRRMGVLDRTWLIVVADHGESFGEHPDVFTHGSSLYQTEVHVPLVIVPPGGKATGRVVTEAVSTRDLAATIADLAGQGSGSTFPGRSLSRFWDGKGPASTPAYSEVVPDPNAPRYLRKPGPIWPLGSIEDDGWSYIRREGEIREELFHLPGDPKEGRNLASDPAARPTLERMRSLLGRMTVGPLLPERFHP